MWKKNYSNKVFKGKIIKSETIAKGVKKITIKIEGTFSYFLWQYVWIELLDLIEDDKLGNRRAFSIFNLPNKDNIIEIVVRISGSAYKQTLFSLSIGQEVRVHGPFGNSFVVNEKSNKNLILIAGGVGIAAFIKLINFIKLAKIPIKCYLLYINSSLEETPFISDLTKIKEQEDFFDFKIKYDHLNWNDINSVINKLNPNYEFFVAGPQGFVTQVYKELESGGETISKIKFENYYPKRDINNLTRELINLNINKENIFSNAIQNSTSHVIITDSEGEIIYANKTAEEITGYFKEEMYGNTPRLWGGMMTKEFYEKFWELKKVGSVFKGEIVNRRKNGELYCAIGHISPIFNKDKKIIGFVGTEEDITNLKDQESKINEAKARLESIISSMNQGLALTDEKGNLTYFNKIAEDLLGKQSNNKNKDTWQEEYGLFDVKTQKPYPVDKLPLYLALQGKNVNNIHMLVKNTKKNKDIIIEVSANPIINEGNMIGAMALFEDVTKKIELEKMKDEFLSIASHELRTPLTAIKGMVSMIQDGDYGAYGDNLKEPLDTIGEASNRLINIVNDMLSSSRLEQGRIKYQLKDFFAKKTINDIVKEIEIIAKNKGINLSANIKDEQSVQADEDKVKEILNNLIGNALKFTDRGSITISSQENKDLIEFDVSDTGTGISKEDQNKLFKKFQQISSEQKGRPKGTGLGLYISKQYAVDLGGDLWIKKSEVNKGSTFTFSLPKTGSKKAFEILKKLSDVANFSPLPKLKT